MPIGMNNIGSSTPPKRSTALIRFCVLNNLTGGGWTYAMSLV